MSTYNYAALAAKARSQIEKFGRAITLIKTDSDTAVGKAWRPDPAPVETTFSSVGLFMPSSGVNLGLSIEISDLKKRSSQFVLIATNEDISTYQFIADGEQRYAIQGMERIKPGDEVVAWIVGVKG